jgi:hypothetical protein
MFDEIVKLILEFCNVSINYFLINKTFDRIYNDVIYTDEMIDYLFKIATYEGNEDLLIKLIRITNNEHVIDDYWIIKNGHNHLLKYSSSNNNDISVLNIDDIKILDMGLKYGFKLIDYFKTIQNNFELSKYNVYPNSWKYKYKHYTIIYFRNIYCNYIFLDDEKNNRRLRIKHDSRLISKESNAKDILSIALDYYIKYAKDILSE